MSCLFIHLSLCPSISDVTTKLRISDISLKFDGVMHSTMKEIIVIKKCPSSASFHVLWCWVARWEDCCTLNALCTRLLHSPSLVAIGLSVGYETWPLIGRHHPFVIGWSKDKLGLPSAPLHYGLTWPVGILIVFQTPVTVSLHCPNGRQATACH